MINNAVSWCDTLNMGIPQDSCLGRFLFFDYINDMFSATNDRGLDCANNISNKELSKGDK